MKGCIMEKRFRTFIFTLGVLILGFLVLIAQPAIATTWVEDFCGHSSMVGVGENIQDGVINFAIADDPDVVFDLGLEFHRGSQGFGNLSPELDTSANYIYLYQPVNTDGNDYFDEVRINFDVEDSHYITSWGYFTIGDQAVIFSEDGNPVGAGNNLGPTDHDPPPPIVETGTIPSGFQAYQDGVLPDVHQYSDHPFVELFESMAVTNDNSSITFHFGGNHVVDGYTGTIFGFTCTDPVIGWDIGRIENGTSAENMVPSPAPEPSTLILLLLGAVGLVGILKQR